MVDLAEVHQQEDGEVPLSQDCDRLMHDRRRVDILGDGVRQFRYRLVVVRRRVQARV